MPIVIIADDLVQQIETLISTVNGISTVIQTQGVMPAFLRFNLSGSGYANSGHGSAGVYSASYSTSVTFTKVNVKKLECRAGSASYNFTGENSGSGRISAEQIINVNNGTDGSFALSGGGMTKVDAHWSGSNNCTVDIFF